MTSTPKGTPRAASNSLELVGIGFGSRPEDVDKMFPIAGRQSDPPDERGVRALRWKWKNLTVSVGFDSGSAVWMRAQLDLDAKDRVYLPVPALGGGDSDLRLGDATSADLLAMGSPDAAVKVEEGVPHPYWDISYGVGAEGAVALGFDAIVQNDQHRGSRFCTATIATVDFMYPYRDDRSPPRDFAC